MSGVSVSEKKFFAGFSSSSSSLSLSLQYWESEQLVISECRSDQQIGNVAVVEHFRRKIGFRLFSLGKCEWCLEVEEGDKLW